MKETRFALGIRDEIRLIAYLTVKIHVLRVGRYSIL